MTDATFTQDERAELERLRAAREKQLQYQRERRNSLRSAGLCVTCRHPVVAGKNMCSACAERAADYKRRHYMKAPRCPHCGAVVSKKKAMELQ